MLTIHRIGLMILLLIITFSLTGCNYVSREEVMKQVKTTDLSNEKLNELELGMQMTEKNFAGFAPHPDNDYYVPQRNFDQYLNDQIILGVDRNTKEILQISTLEGNKTSSSSKGITAGVSIEDVISTYGENYYIYDDTEQTIYLIGYVDHKNNLELSFRHFNGEVRAISLSYAFDRLKWGSQ